MNNRCFTLLLGLAAGCAQQPEPPRVAQPISARPTPSAAAAPASSSKVADRFGYPKTRTVPQVDEIHGVKIADPYRWLEDGKSPEVVAWADEQDKFARAFLVSQADREALRKRLEELYYVESRNLPRKRGKRHFFSRRAANEDVAVWYYRESKTGPEKVLLDPRTWSGVALGTVSLSQDGKKVVYAKRKNNADLATLHVLDVDSGKTSEVDSIDGSRFAHATWTPKGDGFFYDWIPTDASVAPSERMGRIELRFHKLGTSPATDPVVHSSTGDARVTLTGGVSKDGRWLVVELNHGWTRTEIQFKEVGARRKDWVTLPTRPDATYSTSVYKDHLYLSTNEAAPLGRVLRVDLRHPERDRWVEVVPERKDANLDDVTLVGGRLGLAYVKDASSRVELVTLEGKPVREIQFPMPGRSWGWAGVEDDDEAYYTFESFAYPLEYYETSVAKGGAKLLYRRSVPGDTSRYETEQRFATSKDGTKIPYFLTHAKGQVWEGKAKTILHGYGAIGSSLLPEFDAGRLAWLERGGVFAVANLRGGGEYGESWHRAGMGRAKQTTFDDFLAVAEHLISTKVTGPEYLATLGGSGGGLLVAAAMIQRPDLFRAVLCQVPVLDMLRYHLVGAGKSWIDEFGSADNSEDFRALFAYSPYHNIKTGTRYPALLVLSAEADDRVDPMHARKFAAAMQAASAGGRVLLRVERGSGHRGGGGVKPWTESGADKYAFLLSEMSGP